MSGRIACILVCLVSGAALAADVVPQTVKMPGTQPGEVSSLQTASRCDNIQAARPIRPRGAPTGKDNTTSGITSSKGPLRDYRQLRQRPGNAPPIYPSYARQTGAEGTVVLTYDVSSKGNVKNIRISQSSGNRYLDTEAVRAIRRFRYFPGQEGRTVHPVNFRLRGQAKFKSPLRSS